MAWKFFLFVITWLPAFALLSFVDWARHAPIRYKFNLALALTVATANEFIIGRPNARLVLLSFFAGSLGGWTAQLRQIKNGKREHVNPYMMVLSGSVAATLIYFLLRRYPL